MKPWHEDDTFWRDTAAVMFGPSRWAAVPENLAKITALIGLQPGMRVLDLCCGVGRYALELARRGYHVTGVDRTADYLAQAQQRAAAEGLEIEWVQADMREFRRPAVFDVALNLFTSFGYFEDATDDRRVAENLYHSLKPGGTLLMEMSGKEVLARIFQPHGWHEEDGLIVLEERKVTRNWGWMENRWIIFRGAERREHRLGHRLYSATELISLLTSGGFSSADAYGDLEGSPYDHTAKRLVVVAHRSA